MARIRWAVRCTATNRRGERCRQWSRRGSFTCYRHGSSTRRAMAWGAYRLQFVGWLDQDAALAGWREDPQRFKWLLSPSRY